VTPAAAALLEKLTSAYGPPVATPRTVWRNGRSERSAYRVFLWDCPVCRAGADDPGAQLGPVLIRYRPLVLTSDGRLSCIASGCPLEDITSAVDVQLDTLALLRSLNGAAA
jgi:hypothetical protein